MTAEFTALFKGCNIKGRDAAVITLAVSTGARGFIDAVKLAGKTVAVEMEPLQDEMEYGCDLADDPSVYEIMDGSKPIVYDGRTGEVIREEGGEL